LDNIRTKKEVFIGATCKRREQRAQTDAIRLTYSDLGCVTATFTKRPTDKRVVQGDLIQLQCNAFGSPTPSIYWLKDDQSVKSHVDVSEDGTLLTIENADFQDEGRYQCVISNEVGGNRATAHVRVTRVKVIPVLKHRPKDVETVEGSSVRFKCRAFAYPNPKLYWLHENKRVREYLFLYLFLLLYLLNLLLELDDFLNEEFLSDNFII
jgi:hypothetical protein